MTGILNLSLLIIPGGIFYIQLQKQISQPPQNTLDLIREVATFVLSILLAWAVRYIRKSHSEVKKAQELLPTVAQVNSIREDYSVMKADLVLLTDTLERTRIERDNAYHLVETVQKSLDENKELLEKTSKMLEDERQTNDDWGCMSLQADEKIKTLEMQVATLQSVNDVVDKFAIQLVRRVEQLMISRLNTSPTIDELPSTTDSKSIIINKEV